MLRAKRALLLLPLLQQMFAPGALATCVRFQKFASWDCAGAPTQSQNFTVGSGPGSSCVDWGPLSFKDQYCSPDGKFRQMMYASPRCLIPLAEQEFESSVCKFGSVFSCGACEAGTGPEEMSRELPMVATILKYPSLDCTGTPAEETFPAADIKGSKCIKYGVYSIRDQFCDADGNFRQEVFTGEGCQGPSQEQVYERDHCLYGVKLESCRHMSPEAYVV